eukprot:576683-Pelagomonas_calceolata.AAC.2
MAQSLYLNWETMKAQCLATTLIVGPVLHISQVCPTNYVVGQGQESMFTCLRLGQSWPGHRLSVITEKRTTSRGYIESIFLRTNLA